MLILAAAAQAAVTPGLLTVAPAAAAADTPLPGITQNTWDFSHILEPLTG